MADNKALAPMQKALAALQAQLNTLSHVAQRQKQDWSDTMSQISEVRKQIESVRSTIQLLGGEVQDDTLTSDDQQVVNELTAALSQKPLTLKEIGDTMESRGFRRRAVRKALTDIAFARTGDGRYTLRSLLYGL